MRMWSKIAYLNASQAADSSLVSDVQSRFDNQKAAAVDNKSGFRRWFAWHRVVIDGEPVWLCWVERRWLERYHYDGFWDYRRVSNGLAK